MQKQLTPHKHAELIKFWTDNPDTKFQVFVSNYGVWQDISTPTWHLDYEYRIKPEPKLDVVLMGVVSKLTDSYLDANDNRIGFILFQEQGYTSSYDNLNLKLTFDGETGKLKSAEVINK